LRGGSDTRYLIFICWFVDETNNYGNIVRGWEGYLTAKPKGAYAARKQKLPDKVPLCFGAHNVVFAVALTAPICGSWPFP